MHGFHFKYSLNTFSYVVCTVLPSDVKHGAIIAMFND